jgi:hypothetical protein
MNLNQVLQIVSNDRQHVEILGSFADPNLDFFSDIDCQEKVSHITAKKFIRNLQNIVKLVERGEFIYFDDFKMGTYREKSIHFTADEVIAGKKTIPLKKEPVTMEELLLNKSIIKLDVIFWYKKLHRFVELSINYYFHNEGISTRPDHHTELSRIFKNEFFEKLEDNDFIKAIKRLQRLVKLKEEAPVLKQQLEKFLNGKIGFLTQIHASLKTLSKVILLPGFNQWNEYRTEIRSIVRHLEILKSKYGEQLREVLTIDNKEKIASEINELNGIIEKYIQIRSESFLRNLKKLPSFLESV